MSQDVSLIIGGCAGELPPSWGALKKVSTLELSYTGIHGVLPRQWSGMRDLKTIRVRGTAVSGALPASWSQLTNLTMVDLMETDLGGPLPSSWRGMCHRPLTFVYLPWPAGHDAEGLAQLDSVHLTSAGNVCQPKPAGWILKAGIILAAVGSVLVAAAALRWACFCIQPHRPFLPTR